ncbi:MAG: hypothetical protein KC652_19860, partial [Cyanobacteria bacterium HKST-UBA01]|nr:hypothetical protein [Cyanobacteria bacterium HKST-UBA01]
MTDLRENLPEQDGEGGQNPLPEPTPVLVSYFEKIVRHIPATINAAYVASLGLLAEAGPNPAWLHWTVFLVLWALVPFYVLYIPGQ